MYRNQKGFTLAEVLITLAIIGVVAALTIPNLVYNINSTETVVKVQKMQSVLQGAMDMYKYKKHISKLNNKIGDTANFWNEFKPQLKLVKDCGLAVGQDCFPEATTYKYLNGDNAFSFDDIAIEAKAILNDGVIISVYAVNKCNQNASISGAGDLAQKCGYFYADINGHSGPNQIGVDTFAWHIFRNGNIVPAGTDDDKFKGCDRSSDDVTHSDDGAPGFGVGCTAFILQTGSADY